MLDSKSTMEREYANLRKVDWSKSKLDLLDFDRAMIDEFKSNFKKSFVFFTSYLYNVLQVRMRERRVDRRSNKISDSNGGFGDSNQLLNPKRVEIVPEWVLKESNGNRIIQSACVLFCTISNTNIKMEVRKNLLYAMLDGLVFQQKKDLSEILKTKSIREAIDGLKKTHNPKFEKNIIRALLEISDIVGDKNYAKLAWHINNELYRDIVWECTNCEDGKYVSFKTIIPYDPLISKYIEVCIPMMDQIATRKSITKNQFYINRVATVNDIISKLKAPLDKKQAVTADAASERQPKFDDDTLYYVYEDTKQFSKYITSHCENYNGTDYLVSSYRDCLFDVLGTKNESFLDKTWQERLDMLPNHPKILLKKQFGKDLNNLSTNAVLGVSWMDENNKFRYKCCVILNRNNSASKRTRQEVVTDVGEESESGYSNNKRMKSS